MAEPFYHLLYPSRVILLSCIGKDNKSNIITLAWNMPASFDPPMLAVSVGKKRFSHKLIKEAGEFAVNIPSASMRDAVLFCGTNSGRSVDKFKETGLTAEEAVKIKTPLIKEAPASLECRLAGECDAGDHTIFIGEVLHYKRKSSGKGLYDAGNGVLTGI